MRWVRFMGGPGMGAQKAAFQISVAAETAALNNTEFGAGLLDLVKAFETVPHHILVGIAIELGYPLVLLRLCLASYRLRRTIGIDGAYSKMVRACRGITAGSGFATSEMRLVLIRVIDRALTLYPTITPTLFVDDLAAAVCALAKHAIKQMGGSSSTWQPLSPIRSRLSRPPNATSQPAVKRLVTPLC